MHAAERRRLEIALGIYVSRLIIEADGTVDPAEVRHWMRVFPPDELVELGFCDAAGRDLPDLEEAQRDALRSLPRAMSLDEKLSFLRDLHAMAVADDHLEMQEYQVLVEGARFLGVPILQFTKLMTDVTLARRGLEDTRIQLAIG